MMEQENPSRDRGPQARPFVPVLRVLCLHDAGSHALETQEAWEALAQRLHDRHSIELVFVNSPLAVARQRHAAVQDVPSTDEPPRTWWHGDFKIAQGSGDAGEDACPAETSSGERQPLHERMSVNDDDDDDWSDADTDDPTLPQQQEKEEMQKSDDKPTLVGLDASLLYLQQVWTSGPFWGLMGIGQGATVASLFSLLPTTHPPPQCLVLCDAGTPLLQERERLSNVACLHVGPNPSETLVAQFGGRVMRTLLSPSSPQSSGSMSRHVPKSVLNAVGRFLVEQRTITLRDPNSSGGQIVELQAALHVAETDATDYIAREIAANPPKALMAVILPHHVGGWSGDRRRQPGEQGGGAPCPEEFLLHRDKRTAASEGASRHHPGSSDAKVQNFE